MKENKLRKLLNENKPSLGTRISSTWPVITEAVGASRNFDYIEFVAEYAPFSHYDLENIARAAELHGLSSMIKVDFQNKNYIAQKAIASGFQAINFTDIKNADEVREAISAVKADSPRYKGRFGYPNRRFIGYQPYVTQQEHVERVNDIVLCFMIEKAEAMENIEEICSVPGVDMVQFGPSDYSMSKGWNMAEHIEECKAAERKMIEVAKKYGVEPRCEIYGDPTDVKYYLDLGVKHICFGDQIKVYTDFLNKDGKIMREIVEGIM